MAGFEAKFHGSWQQVGVHLRAAEQQSNRVAGNFGMNISSFKNYCSTALLLYKD